MQPLKVKPTNYNKKMKIRHLLLPALLLVTCVITSCSKDDETEPQKETKTVYLVKSLITNNEAWGTFSDYMVYNNNLQLTQTISSWGSVADTFNYSYDASGRIEIITKNGDDYKTYEYREMAILEKTWSASTGEWSTVQFNLNADGKAIREQDINTTVYAAYEWVNGNRTKMTTYNGSDIVEVKNILFNTTVKNPLNERYAGTLLAVTSTNMQADAGEYGDIIYTTNSAGYPLTISTPTAFGDFNSTYTYETKIVEIN